MNLKRLLVIVALIGPCVAKGHNPFDVGASPGRSSGQLTAARYEAQKAYGKLPLSFEVIPGARAGEANAVARSRGFSLLLIGSEADIVIGEDNPAKKQFLQMRVLGANRNASAIGIGRLETRSNYLIGNDANKWRVGIPNFDRVLLRNVYPGIDLTYYGQQGDLEYDFVVAPGSDPRCIRIKFAGARQLRLSGGDLLLRMSDGELRLHKPLVYQVRQDGKKLPITGHFRLTNHNEVTFEIGHYDPRRATVIDPGLVYSSYLGGSGRDEALGIAVGKDGSAYVVGSTTSSDFPVSRSGMQSSIGRGESSVFVTKLNPSGDAIEYSTYLGGSQRSTGAAIAVNQNGEAYITGSTYSPDFPVTHGVMQPNNAGNMDAFIAELSADGSQLLYSTYLGGSGEDEAHALALDASGNAFVAGSTFSNDFPSNAVRNHANCGAAPCRQAFVARVNPTASAADYATFIGGSGDTSASSIALDLSGAAYIAGDTAAKDFPATTASFLTHASDHSECLVVGGKCGDVFVAKLSSLGTVLYATNIGGSGDQHANAIAVDEAGAAYVTGGTDSKDFPITSGAFRSVPSPGTTKAFIFKVNPVGSTLEFSTLLGGQQEDEGKSIALDTTRHVYVAGRTSSSLFPTTADAFQNRLTGKSAGFLSRLDSSGAKLEYSTFFGGSGSDVATAVALDSAGNIYLAGSTDSIDFPLLKPLQKNLTGERNAFVAKFGAAPSGAEQVGNSPASTAAPIVKLSATLLQFLNQKPGTSSASQTVTLTNSGTASLTSIVVGVAGTNAADFSVTTTPPTNCGGILAAGATCTLTVTFKPAVTGVRVASVNIADNASNSPQSVGLTGNPPIASISTNSLKFASQPEGRLSPYQTVELKNGSLYSSLVVSGISLSGSNYQEANNCPTSLTVSASCTVTVAFMPATTGTLAADLIFSDNSLNNSASVQTLALSGAATGAPVASLSTTSVNFGTIPQGTDSAPKAVTLTNTGVSSLTISNVYVTAADSFILSNGSGSCSTTTSLKPGASCTMSITFYSNPGIQTSTILVTDNSGTSTGTVQEISLIGTGATGVYNGQFSATLVNFGSVKMGSAGVQKIVQFKNTGTLPLALGATSLFTNDHYDYQVQPASSNGCGVITLAVGASCNIAIIFNPAFGSPGPRTTTASVTVAAPYFTEAIYLTGMATGQSIPVLSSTGLTFGTEEVGSSSAAKSIVLKNAGNEPLTISGLDMNGADFSVVPAATNNCSPTGGTVLAPGTSCNISVEFAPKSAGTLSEFLMIVTDADGGSELYVALTGTGQSTTPGPIVSMSTNSLNFGGQKAGTVSAVRAITLTNSGTVPWYISGGSSNSNYVIETPCNSYVNPGSSCVVNVYFAPTALGPQPYYASLQLSTSTGYSNFVLVFNGTGTGSLAESVSTTNLNLGTATSGSLGSSGSVTFTNTGKVPYPFGNIELEELNPVGTGANPDFQQTNNCQFGSAGMPVGASCSVFITFTPAIGPAGERQTLLIFQGGTGTSPQPTVVVSGTATGTPVLSVSPPSFKFLDQIQGTSSSVLAVHISNNGTAPMPFNVTSSGGEFPPIYYDCPSTLEQGESCVAYYAFSPNPNPVFGPRLSNLVVSTGTGFVSQQLVSLSGFGTPPQ